ncbi:Aldehyde dehydrogenase A / Glycolaldehyde dehydrogenase [Klebsiella pneumoniae IS43]|uniref:Aldehyde dehydrogenase A / Glycolaldehyde dehydrogenase n=1 Tax=Klebsiella pneumoniae IS43 TaxID=1432552 RepID=W1DLB9_KLEPN|nr:Aldehyde dehydrogenase A / Glycolaldehyde dehydrogenase [Klebsiella pneumoniae IS43]
MALGGQPLEGKGYFYPPTLLLDVRQEMDIIHEEPRSGAAGGGLFDPR